MFDEENGRECLGESDGGLVHHLVRASCRSIDYDADGNALMKLCYSLSTLYTSFSSFCFFYLVLAMLFNIVI